MNTNLLDILKNHSSKESDRPSHMSYYGPNNKWMIKETEWEDFWFGYNDLVYSESKNLCLAEMPKRHMPVIVDCTLKFQNLEEEESYGMDFIMAVVYCYQQILMDALYITSDEELTCCVLESKECVEDGILVTRFRLHFPYCKTLANTQIKVIRPKAIKLLRTEHVIVRLNQTPINDWETIIDSTTPTSPCIMYGSSKSPDISPYELLYIVGKVELDDIQNAIHKEPEEVFNFDRHDHYGKGFVTKNIFEKEKDLTFWLPYFLSLEYYGKVAKTKSSNEEYESISNASNSKSWSSGFGRNSDSSSSQEQTPEMMAERFLSMLDVIDRQQEHFWLDIGKSLYNVFKGSERGLELWIQFTEKSDEYTSEDCINRYPTFINNKLTIKTLAWFAREDSKNDYDMWHKEWYGPALEKALSTLDNDVAEAIYRVYWLEFACSTLNKKGMFYFENHIWKRQESGYSLRIKISKEFTGILEKLHTEISMQVQETNDTSVKDLLQLNLKKILNLINRLKSHRFKEGVLSEIQEKFFIENFESYLDSNDSTLGCMNGVIETTDKEAVSRSGKPEDYISKTTGLILKEFKSMNDPKVQEVVKWFNQVFPDKELCKYVSKMFASCLRGRNSEKIFAVLTGAGDNSKSMLKKAFECVFGGYCITFPTAIFTTKRNGTGPIPEIARSKAVRVAFVQEPDSDDSMRNGAIKEFTGGDRFFARMCNDNGGEIEAMFKLFLMCNHVPIIPHSDKAIKNRVRILPFLSTWVSNAPKTDEERQKERLFQKDPRFEHKIPGMAPAMMWYLMQMYNEYCKEGLKQPEVISQHTKEYWQNNDIYLQFLTENIIKAYKEIPNWPENKEKPLDEDECVKVSEMYTLFKDWYKDFYPSQKCPERPIMVEEVDARLNQKSYGKQWSGIKKRLEVCSI